MHVVVYAFVHAHGVLQRDMVVHRWITRGVMVSWVTTGILLLCLNYRVPAVGKRIAEFTLMRLFFPCVIKFTCLGKGRVKKFRCGFIVLEFLYNWAWRRVARACSPSIWDVQT